MLFRKYLPMLAGVAVPLLLLAFGPDFRTAQEPESVRLSQDVPAQDAARSRSPSH